MCDYSIHSEAYLKGIRNKVLCMEVATIFYYMEGLHKQGGAQSTTDQGEGELWSYLRCMIGTWTLMKLHGKQCKIKEITTHVSTLMRTMEEGFNAVTNRDKCAWVQFEALKIGTRLMGEAMDEWITDWKGRRPKITQGISAGGCDNVGGGRMRAASAAGDGPSNNIGILKSENLDKLHRLIENKDYLPKARVRDIMVKVGNSQHTQQGKKILEDAINTWDHERTKIPSNAAETSGTPAAPSGASDTGTTGNARGTSKPATAPTEPAATSGSTAAAAKPAATKPVGDTDDQTKGKGKQSEAKTPVSTPGASPARSDPTTGKTSVVAPGPVPQPPPAAPPTEAGVGGAGAAARADGNSTEPTVKASDAKSPGKAPCPDSNGRSTGVSISCGSTSDSDLGLTDDVRQLLQQEEKEREQAPISPSPNSGTGDTSSMIHDACEYTSDAVVDGTNDDPPPQPPNTNPLETVGPNPDDKSYGIDIPGLTEKPCYQENNTCSSGTGNSNIQVTGGLPGVQSPPAGTKKGDFELQLTQLTGISSVTRSFAPPNVEDVTLNEDNENLLKTGPPSGDGPLFPDLTDTVLTATTPILFFLTAAIVALLGYSLWKYFAYLGTKRRRTYRTVRDVPSPPLDEQILDHLQRGDLPPPLHYGYTMSRERRRDKFADRRRRPPCVHKRTIIELHLEVLHECEAAEWENVKDDYLQILVEEFMGGNNGHSSFPNADTPNEGLSGSNVSSTDSDGTDPSAPNEDDPDPWSCMESIQLEQDDTPSSLAYCSDPGNANLTPDHTNWINWIDRNKHLLQDCTTQPWFLELKAEWKQYLRDHMLATEDNGVSAQRELGEHANIPSVEMKQDAWKQWVAKQHALMNTYSAQVWFQHLLNNVHEETVPQKGEVSVVEKDLKVETVNAAHVLRARDIPGPQTLHQDAHTKKHLLAKLWILLLASVIEQCEIERSVQDRESYVDALLHQL
ncbi:hypothetical protein AK88_04985 [Plasmodium fragile]|uniref:Schizont-infected cell agglutination C-terminal domain-containing protein n=1 Tax=Plasmodium fragile TaxID=5857 RepID=A0A0D9QE96_PLAFR|nr:uncharacterized protein AK88_04985 [Plasmodium fragile]KJP85385.1 hypothetical protein AK88_04985 [Plasmodium fragile]